MTASQDSNIPAGWVGGFAESNPAFKYPHPDLSSLRMWGNMDNLKQIKRQQKVNWPEFSWWTQPDAPTKSEREKSRCFQMFAPDISRVGYDDTGRIWSIICPQQGACFHEELCLNVEITVTGQRGWVNEDTKELAADMTVEGKIWFSPSSHGHWIIKRLYKHFENNCLPFPLDKANAIRVTTHSPGNPEHASFTVQSGTSTNFKIPDFAIHESEAWTVGNIEVQIGPVIQTGYEVVDIFNKSVVDIFNIASGNMLKSGNILTWDVWFTEPELVNTLEWAQHAEQWRKSIDADHSPTSPGRPASYADGTPFKPAEETKKILEEVAELIIGEFEAEEKQAQHNQCGK